MLLLPRRDGSSAGVELESVGSGLGEPRADRGAIGRGGVFDGGVEVWGEGDGTLVSLRHDRRVVQAVGQRRGIGRARLFPPASAGSVDKRLLSSVFDLDG